MKTTTIMKHTSAPRFEFHFTRQAHENGVITADGEIIHRIVNTHYFYIALGYTEEMSDSGLSFDDFILQEYRSDNTFKDACLQAKLIEYLIKYSTNFMTKYGSQHQNWLCTYSSKGITHSENCSSCEMHLHQNEYFNPIKQFFKRSWLL